MTHGYLATIIMLTGATSGWLNSGITSLFLTTWGPEKSRPYIASFHFTFSVGAILAPVLVGIYKDTTSPKSCPNQDDDFYHIRSLYINQSSQLRTDTDESSCTVWQFLCDGEFFNELDINIIPPYWIVAIGVMLTGIGMIIGALFELVEHVTTNQDRVFNLNFYF